MRTPSSFLHSIDMLLQEQEQEGLVPGDEANALASGTCPTVAQVWSALMFGGWSACEHHPASYIALTCCCRSMSRKDLCLRKKQTHLHQGLVPLLPRCGVL